MKTQNFKAFEIVFFIFIVTFWIFPPFFIEKAQEGVFEAVYPLSTFVNFSLSVFIYFLFSHFREKKEISRINTISEAMIAIGFIFLFSAIFNAFLHFGFFFGGTRAVVFPKGSFLNVLNCIFGTFFAAFSEEVLYRFYLPSQILSFFGSKSEKKAVRFSVESVCVFVFALSHLNSGVLNVVFAAISGTVLRRCFLKTNNLILVALIHGFYNFVTIIVSSV